MNQQEDSQQQQLLSQTQGNSKSVTDHKQNQIQTQEGLSASQEQSNSLSKSPINRHHSLHPAQTSHAWVDFEEDPDVQHGKFAQQAQTKRQMQSQRLAPGQHQSLNASDIDRLVQDEEQDDQNNNRVPDEFDDTQNENIYQTAERPKLSMALINRDEANISLKRESGVMMSPSAGQRGFMKRAFGKIEAGSLRASVLGMIVAAVGSGILTMPNIFERTGWLMGCILILMGGGGCYWSLYMLVQRARHHNLLNYSQVTRKAGGPCLEKVLQISILLYMYATCLACEIVITQLVVILANNVFGISQEITGSPNGNEGGLPSLFKVVQTIVFAVFILLPISLNKSMSSFRLLGIVSLSCLFFTVTVVVVEYPFYQEIYIPDNPKFSVNTVCLSMDTFATAGIIFFAFTNQCNVLPVYSELVRPCKYRLMKIITRAMTVITLCYLLMSLAGYFSTLNATPEVICERPPFSSSLSADWPMMLATLLIGMVMISNIATNFFPFRGISVYLITGKQEIPDRLNWILAICFQIATGIVALFFPSITAVLSIFGGIASVNICYIVPLTCYIKLRKPGESLLLPKNLLAIIYFCIMIVIGWMSSLSVVLSFVIPDTATNPLFNCQRDLPTS